MKTNASKKNTHVHTHELGGLGEKIMNTLVIFLIALYNIYFDYLSFKYYYLTTRSSKKAACLLYDVVYRVFGRHWHSLLLLFVKWMEREEAEAR